MYTHINQETNELESKITEIYNFLDCHIHSIKGIGLITAAGIISEIGNITKFISPNQLLAYAGLDPSTNESGTIRKMVKWLNMDHHT